MDSAAKSAFNFHNHGHFCLVCKYQGQQTTLPCCLWSSVSGNCQEHTQEISLAHRELSSQKIQRLMFPKNQGLRMKFFFQLFEGSLNSIFNHRHPLQHHPCHSAHWSSPTNSWLSPNWSQSSTPCIHLLSHQGQVSCLAFPACPS